MRTSLGRSQSPISYFDVFLMCGGGLHHQVLLLVMSCCVPDLRITQYNRLCSVEECLCVRFGEASIDVCIDLNIELIQPHISPIFALMTLLAEPCTMVEVYSHIS